ncbi:MAG: hypothetical protein M3Y58_08470 [Chloroflexota bacterium]|nr:hypothetical protein [Chloroflexota bacterium]
MSGKPSKKGTDRVKKVIQAAVVKWKPLMGLGHWEIHTCWYRRENDIPKEFRPRPKRNYRGAKMWVRVDWEYLEAWVNVNLPECVDDDAERLEHIIMHELAHVVVNEMREWATHPADHAMKHEERVVETRALSFMWAHFAGWNEGRDDLRKKRTKGG